MNFPFSKVNYQRCIAPEGFNYNPVFVEEFNMYMLLCMQEELGEIAGAFKKLKRGFNQRELKKIRDKWAKNAQDEDDVPTDEVFKMIWITNKMKDMFSECADFLIYFDLFLTRNNIDIHAIVKEKFNKVSEEMNCPQYKID